jgi:hypothetical protein
LAEFTGDPTIADVPFSQRRWCNVREACQYSGFGRTKLFAELAAGGIESKLEGRRRLVSVPSLIARCEGDVADVLRDDAAMTGRKRTTGRELVILDPARLISEVNDPLDLGPILQDLLARHSLHVAEVRELGHAWQLRTWEGPIINIYRTGTVPPPQGQRVDLAGKFVEELRLVINELGHDLGRLTGPS